ncbi:DeoR/GlpR family transcriptional regulator of sugar metabolism [Microbacterium resistens]|uniref:Lactose phosphotransferase system repressor n=1 Tax=Microbacterium resistens TaxID=156977 RepID=A0ABU1SAX7_9MICO|nr:DeoR/GlpR family DNA-binding transcription regulator [Microbacterium resistens]MDR6866773.1 DeoR/GlpR family transcriptional regulator of sugar metabolism [Microbacterium resistens]
MLAASRKELLLERLRRDGRIVAKDIARELGLSEDSIRRDLRELDDAGLAVRVYGGALPASPATADYAARTAVAPDSKRRVAALAAGLIRPGATVILDGGTTTLAVVDALPKTLACTIITHSPTIATSLLDHSAEVFLIGGRLFKHSAVASGAAAVEAASRISADLFLLGVTGVHPTAGLTTGDADEAAMKRALAARAAETYVLASEEKLGTASRYEVLPLDAVAAVVTDVGADDPTARELAAQGVTLLGPSTGP